MSSTNVPTRVDESTIAPLSAARTSFDESEKRYAQGEVIGKGGMGVVWSCTDRRIGRDVAMKTIHEGLGEESTRFLREACVQGQLEHPAIVPVHDLGRNEAGELFFTMKRIRGVTLREILQKLRGNDADTKQQYSRRKILTAFATVCNAIQFAHARGVIHRDLKPANVMIGHFGEVYVLDWGIAKVIGWDEVLRASLERVSASDRTVDGAQIGTPGYMSPEQVRGEPADARSDIYSLGAILFEILTLERLVPKEDALAATIEGADARPSKRTPNIDVPPELEAICVKATALESSERFSSVRALTDAIERFLDGDRDVERRKELATEHATRATELAERAIDGAIEARTQALSEVGRALALDPSNALAAETFLRLMTRPPTIMPAEVHADLVAEAQKQRFVSMRQASVSQLVPLLLLPFLVLMHAKPVLYLGMLGWLVTAAIAWLESTRKQAGEDRGSYPVMISSCVANALFATWFGPYLIGPSVAAIIVILPIIAIRPRRRRPFVLLSAVASVVLPAALAWLGVIPSFHSYRDGTMSIATGFAELTPRWAEALLAVGTTSVLGASVFAASMLRDELTKVQDQVRIQAWQLRQLVGQRPV